MKRCPGSAISLIAACAATALSGCGGANSTDNSASGQRGALKITVQWPSARGAGSRLIPVLTKAILVVVKTDDGKLVGATTLVRPPAGVNSTSATITLLPVGHVTVTANADAVSNPYPDSDVPQATGSVSATVVYNQTVTTPDLVMYSTITKLEVTPPAVNVSAGAPSVILTVSAKDKNGNVVLTPAANFTWASDNAPVATVTRTGLTSTLQGVSAGSARITVTESDSSVVSTAVTATVAATPRPVANIFVADSANNRIFGLDKILAPTVTTFTGFTNLNDLSVDHINSLIYVVDSARILQMDFAGNIKHTYTPPNTPFLVHVGSNGTVYYYDSNFQLNMMTNFTSGHVDKSVGSATHPFNGPMAIATDTSGYVYVSDSNLNTIYRFDPNLTTGDGLSTYGSPAVFNLAAGLQLHDLAIDSANHVYVADTLNNRIVRFDAKAFNDPATANLVSCAVPSSTPGLKFWPLTIAVDSASPNPHIFVTGFESATYSLFTPTNVFVLRMDDIFGTNLQRFGGPRGSGANQMAIPLAIGVR